MSLAQTDPQKATCRTLCSPKLRGLWYRQEDQHQATVTTIRVATCGRAKAFGRQARQIGIPARHPYPTARNLLDQRWRADPHRERKSLAKGTYQHMPDKPFPGSPRILRDPGPPATTCCRSMLADVSRGPAGGALRDMVLCGTGFAGQATMSQDRLCGTANHEPGARRPGVAPPPASHPARNHPQFPLPPPSGRWAAGEGRAELLMINGFPRAATPTPAARPSPTPSSHAVPARLSRSVRLPAA